MYQTESMRQTKNKTVAHKVKYKFINIRQRVKDYDNKKLINKNNIVKSQQINKHSRCQNLQKKVIQK